ncbi:MAG: PAS domain S-box protein [Syntrophales bacterium]|nr:PAS domain S-box protein [Syntrophales bacterium]
MSDHSRTDRELIPENAALMELVLGLKNAELVQVRDGKYRMIAESMFDIFWVTDLSLRALYNSPSFERVLGFTSEERNSQRPEEVFTPSSLQGVMERFAEELALEEQGLADPDRVIVVDAEFYHRDGSTRWLENMVMGVRDEQGVIVGTVGVSRDITERKRVEEALRQSEEKYRNLVENLNEIVYALDDKGVITYMSSGIDRIGGHKPEELIGKHYIDFVHPDDREGRIDQFQKVLAGVYEPSEYRFLAKDGTPLWMRTSGRAIFQDEQLIGVQGTLVDITDRKRAEEALMESSTRLTTILDSLDAHVYIADMETYEVLFTNLFGRKLWGDTIGQKCWSVFQKDQKGPCSFCTNEKLLDRDGKPTGVYAWEFQNTVNGMWFDCRDLAIPWTDGRMVRMEIATNITDRKCVEQEKFELERQLAQSQKLESLGTLAGGIAHDFNNLMTSVQGYVELAIMDMPSNTVPYKRLKAALQSIAQTRELTGRLITFSRGGLPWKKITDVADVIKDAVHRIVNVGRVNTSFDLPDNLWPVEADEQQLRQCFFNLALNAVEAMPDGGVLSVQAENIIASTGEVPNLKEGEYLRITFSDNGTGIAPEIAPKIFDPYFTTKGMGTQKGMGLGLAVCYSVLKKHSGTITFTSQPGKGSAFVIHIPARLGTAKASSDTQPSFHGRVLIMDDESHIRDVERAFLERLGCEVTEVQDGRQAIDSYSEGLVSGNTFDLVMLDLTVREGMGGLAAMEELLKIDPAVMAIIVSGFTDDIVVENYAVYGFLGALKKPFKGEELKRIVEELME